MKPPVNFLEPLPVDVGVDLGRADLRMAEHLLDHPEVGPPSEEMGGEGMPQNMGAGLLVNPGLPQVFPDQPPEPLPGKRLPPPGEE